MTYAAHAEIANKAKISDANIHQSGAQLSASLFADGDKSFMDSFRQMQKLNQNASDYLVQFELTDFKGPLLKRLEGHVEKDDPFSNLEIVKNADGSVVHRENGRVTEIEYPKGGGATFKYSEDGVVESIKQTSPDGSNSELHRIYPNSPDGTPNYAIRKTDKDGNIIKLDDNVQDVTVRVKDDGSFTVGYYTTNGYGSKEYTNSENGTDGTKKYSKGEPPQNS
jgi:hypothetical protein